MKDPSYLLEERFLPVANLLIWTAFALAYFRHRSDTVHPWSAEPLKLGRSMASRGSTARLPGRRGHQESRVHVGARLLCRTGPMDIPHLRGRPNEPDMRSRRTAMAQAPPPLPKASGTHAGHYAARQHVRPAPSGPAGLTRRRGRFEPAGEGQAATPAGRLTILKLLEPTAWLPRRALSPPTRDLGDGDHVSGVVEAPLPPSDSR